MAFIVYGWQKTPIGLDEVECYQCPNCEKLNTTYAFVYSKYFHFFWIPFFPDHKLIITNCSECNFKRGAERFGPILLEQIKGLTRKYRHPWWTWSLLLLLITVFLGIIADSVL